MHVRPSQQFDQGPYAVFCNCPPPLRLACCQLTCGMQTVTNPAKTAKDAALLPQGYLGSQDNDRGRLIVWHPRNCTVGMRIA
jgi:hypothetical protein